MELIIDADGLILGRMASFVAKKLLEGNKVFILNAENAIISGSPRTTFEKYKRRIDRGGISRSGPYYPRRPDLLVKRAIRGMLSYKQEKGRSALKRLRVYIGVPEDLSDKKAERIASADAKRLSRARVIKIGELCRQLGWTGGKIG